MWWPRLLQSTTPTKATDLLTAMLLEKHTSLASQLANNAYGRPLYLDSVQTSNRVTGNAGHCQASCRICFDHSGCFLCSL